MAFLFWLFRGALFFFGITASGGSFPKPLSAEEERRCISALANGDEDARQKLIVHNLRLVSHVVRKYTVPGYTQEDLVSVGTLGLIKAIQSYKAESGTKLTTYAARCIENEVLMLLRASKKQKGEVSLFDSLGTDGEGNDISFADILGTPDGQVEDEVIHRISMDAVRQEVQKLPRRERMVIEMRFGLLDGRQYAQHEVADVLGVSRSYVSRRHYCKRCPKAGKKPSGIDIFLHKRQLFGALPAMFVPSKNRTKKRWSLPPLGYR